MHTSQTIWTKTLTPLRQLPPQSNLLHYCCLAIPSTDCRITRPMSDPNISLAFAALKSPPNSKSLMQISTLMLLELSISKASRRVEIEDKIFQAISQLTFSFSYFIGCFHMNYLCSFYRFFIPTRMFFPNKENSF